MIFRLEGNPEPVKQWFRDSLLAVAGRSIAAKDVLDRLLAGMAASPSPAEFARNWLRRKALYPLAEYGNENVLQLPGLNIGSPVERILVRHIPLVFPLPAPLHREVCDCMRRAVRTARMQHPTRFEDAVLRLNALWDGLAEELQGWLEIQPRGMSLRAARAPATTTGICRERAGPAARPAIYPAGTGAGLAGDRRRF